MRYRIIQKTLLFIGAVLMLGITGCAGDESAEAITASEDRVIKSEEWEKASQSPYAKYPELVTYTLGQTSGDNNANLPEGATYEDNAYTNYLREMLNVQNDSIILESEERYNDFIDILVKDENLPDVLVLTDRDMLTELVENDMVEDLTEVYENCTTDRIREMFESYGSGLLDSVKFNGRMMAIPETVTDHGPCLLWLRKDWMDQLGLSEPKTLEEAFDIIEAFQNNHMGAGPSEEAIGLLCDSGLVGTTSSNYSADPIFDSFGANPQCWQENERGEIVYGSLTEETKQAITCLRDLYARGILDSNFALREQNNLRDLVVSGRCGAFFGLWWTPNNPLMEQHEKDSSSDWVPYYLTAKSGHGENAYTNFRDNKYVVVRKGYEHPEIVMKIISVLFDYTRYEAKDAEEINDYFAMNVDPKARPLVINVDYNEATYKITENLRRALAGEISVSDLSAIEASYYKACNHYIADGSRAGEDWAAYKSRISAVGLLVDAKYQPVTRKYLPDGEGQIPQTLQNLEKDTFIQMIMGKRSMDTFDDFVEEWYAQGGAELTQRLNAAKR